MSRVAIIMLALWLILFGLSSFINLGELEPLVNVLAIVAGGLLLISR